MRTHDVQRLDEKCPTCGEHLLFSYPLGDDGESRVGYDAKFCRRCDVWLEKGCSDPNCRYCSHRPARPSLVPYPDASD